MAFNPSPRSILAAFDQVESDLIEFLGRVDEQVKRLGFRIEPGEIEAALRCHPSVTDTVVIVRKGSSGDPQLIAYVTSPAAGSDLGSELLGFLRGKLPPFMVPQAIQVMASFALGPNGKIDRSKLPAIARPSIQKVANPPETSIESVISQAWKKVLRIEYAGVEDHFFDLGGDSLQLLQVHAELQRTASFAISVMDLFEFPTTRALARHLSGGFQDAKPAVEDRARKQREAHQNQRIARRGIPA
jgi:acyl carrier protein